MASGKYTDLHIHCENITFEAHRAVICSRSPVLANLVDALEGDGQNIRHLDLTHDGILVVQELLYWMYTSNYSDCRDFCLAKEKKSHLKSETEPSSSRRRSMANNIPTKSSSKSRHQTLTPVCLIFNTKMFLAAITYQLPDLKTLAKEKYVLAMTYFWDNEEFVESVGLLWSNTKGMEEELKDEVAQVVFTNLERLEKYEEFRTILWGEGSHQSGGKDFARDLLVAGRRVATTKNNEMGGEGEEENGNAVRGFMEKVFCYKS
ncbi:hypothetical protein N431DRAFT_447658 [Stipitochalara longipes BDJ]|nr:hypothetical protein N431DRAFT_447658 [Stipitochalara longipes BDJ]